MRYYSIQILLPLIFNLELCESKSIYSIFEKDGFIHVKSNVFTRNEFKKRDSGLVCSGIKITKYIRTKEGCDPVPVETLFCRGNCKNNSSNKCAATKTEERAIPGICRINAGAGNQISEKVFIEFKTVVVTECGCSN